MISKGLEIFRDAYYRTLGYYPSHIHGFDYRLDPDHVGWWKSIARGRWEPETYKILTKYLNADSVYLDVGTWIGPTVIYAAKICKQVVCFEPDPVAYRYLRWNIDLNKFRNVTSFSIALSSQTAIQRMASFGGNLGDSMTSLLNDKQGSTGVDVLTVSWDEFMTVYKINKIDFIKIDIEGGEFTLLPAMKEYLSLHRPTVYLSTHSPIFSADMRREKMQLIIDVMGCYKNCLDHNLRPINIQELGNEEAVNQYNSYVFTD